MAIALVAWPALAGCLAPRLVGVRPVSLEEGRREFDTCALEGDRLSALTREVLSLRDLEPLLASDPVGVLATLHAQALAEPQRPTLFALAETSYWLAKNRQDRGCFLAAALYAYLYLLDESAGPPPSPYDRRFRWAVDIHNQALLRVGSKYDSEKYTLPAGEYALPIGKVSIRVDSSFLAETEKPVEFLSADRFRIEGLRLRLRDAGLGVPLIGLTDPEGKGKENHDLVRTASRTQPVTAFLHLAGGLADFANGLSATLELHSSYDSATVAIGESEVPLETDRSTVLAHALNQPDVWRFSLKGLFGSAAATQDNHLLLVQPYERGRVPVVFVHGTGSSPAYWADLFNSLWWDPELRKGAQFWFFKYATGNPIPFSAADLRDALAEAVARFDPAGTDEALRHMVVIGHSQGGLLTRLLVVDGSLAWFEEITGKSFDSFGFDAEMRALLTRCLDFDPSPFVSRVIYVSTPHRGSFLAQKWYAPIMAGLISLPQDISATGQRFLAGLRGDDSFKGLTSLEGMDPDGNFLKRLVAAPTAPGVHAHSIISIGDADPRDPAAVLSADDGVVEYTSAHLEGVESEDLIPSPHSCQRHPATIQAVRRILLEHLRALRAKSAP